LAEQPTDALALPTEDPWDRLPSEATQALAQALHYKAARTNFRFYEALGTDATEREYYVLGQTAVPDPAWHCVDPIVGWLLARWLREGTAQAFRHDGTEGVYKILC
jgi:hypothetical protein